MASIHHGDLARLLTAFREHRNDSPQSVETRLAELAKQAADEGHAVRLVGTPPGSSVAWLETEYDKAVELDPIDLELIAGAYHIPPLLLYPLLCDGLSDPCHVAAEASFVPVGLRPGSANPGRGATYRRPPVRLRGTEEVAVVLLELDPGGCSDTHAHPGDELMLVLDGEVEIRLEDSGLWTRLSRHDYIHFYAEQTHTVWNLSDRSSRVLVVRFYQLRSAGTRGELAAALKAKKLNPNLSARIRTEMTAALAPFPPQQPHGAAEDVQDRYGFARLLKRLCAAGYQGQAGRLTLNILLDRAGRGGYDYTRAHLDRLNHGQVGATVDELPALAEVYGTEPLILYPLVFPAFRQAVAVRREFDLRSIPGRFVKHAGAEYWAPARRLADSDMSVAVVRLAPGASTPTNHHPGQEILVPLAGSAEVGFGTTHATVTAGRDAFAHYLSGTDHRVSNVTDRPTELFVIRFYGE